MTTALRGLLKEDATWNGTVELAGDVIVPAGRTLVVSAGTEVACLREPAESTLQPRPGLSAGFDPSRTRAARLVVAGRLIVRGSSSSPVRFTGSFWGGILAVGRGRVTLRHATVAAPAHAFVAVDFARAAFADCAIAGERIGAALGGCASAVFRRCRFDLSTEAGLLAADDARALLNRCSFNRTRTAAVGEGCADLRLRECAARGCASGVRAAASARVSVQKVLFEDCEVAASAQGRSDLSLAYCRASRGRRGWEAMDDARLAVRHSSCVDHETGLWTQNRSRAFCIDCRFEGGAFGLRASHRSRLGAWGAATDEQSISGVLIENRAYASMKNCVDGSARGAPGLRNSARAELDGFVLHRRMLHE